MRLFKITRIKKDASGKTYKIIRAIEYDLTGKSKLRYFQIIKQ